MANLYARDTALNNVSGRSEYISDQKRQEEIVLHEKNMKFTWQDYSNFEANNQKSSNKNIEARETVIALPNELYQDKKKLKAFCDDLAKSMYGVNRDYEYAVHWNKARTNLHVHFIYSEREINLEATPKRYKRDLWVNSKTGKTCSKNSPEAILRCRKGDIQRDSEGNVKYDNSPFTVKDKKYNNKNWLNERNKLIKRVFDKHKFKINVFDKEGPYLPQKKLYKGAKQDYLDYALTWNYNAKLLNNQFKETVIPAIRKLNSTPKVEITNQEHLLASDKQEKQDSYLGKFGSNKMSFFEKIKYSLFEKEIDKHYLDDFYKRRKQSRNYTKAKKKFDGVIDKFNNRKDYIYKNISTINKHNTYFKALEQKEKQAKEQQQSKVPIRDKKQFSTMLDDLKKRHKEKSKTNELNKKPRNRGLSR